MVNMLKQIGRRWQICLWIGIATAPLVAASLDQAATRSMRVALYASVGDELICYSIDVEHGTLTRQSSVTLPGFVQEAWAASSTPFLYVAWSNGGASYLGSGVAASGDKHGVTAFRIDAASGALHVQGAAASLRSRAQSTSPEIFPAGICWSPTTIRAACPFTRSTATGRLVRKCRRPTAWTSASMRIRSACSPPTRASSS